jgi:hypothetical protein
VTFEVVPALVAGLAATIVMSAMMSMAASAGMTRMPPMPLVMGSMMTGEPRQAVRLGTMLHYLVMGTLVFGLLYAALFTSFGSSSVLTGVAIGAVHGLVVGAMAMPMMPAMHPRMSASSEGPAADTSSGTVVLSAPGFFASNWGSMTPVGLVAGHVVYGLVAALIYGALV